MSARWARPEYGEFIDGLQAKLHALKARGDLTEVEYEILSNSLVCGVEGGDPFAGWRAQAKRGRKPVSERRDAIAIFIAVYRFVKRVTIKAAKSRARELTRQSEGQIDDAWSEGREFAEEQVTKYAERLAKDAAWSAAVLNQATADMIASCKVPKNTKQLL